MTARCSALTAIGVALALAGATTARLAAEAAQDPHAAQPERPTVATHAGTVAPGWIEIEVGGESDRYADHSRGGVVPIETKIGLASHIQLSLFDSISHPPATSTTGIGDFAAGVKWRLTDHAPIVGRFALLPIVKVPSASSLSGVGTGTTDVALWVISSHNLGPVALDLNIAYTHRSGTGETVPKRGTVWTVSFGGPGIGWLGWAAELYGYPRTTGPAGSAGIVAILLGPTFEIRPWLILDAGAIMPLTGPQPHAIYAGATYNIGQIWTR